MCLTCTSMMLWILIGLIQFLYNGHVISGNIPKKKTNIIIVRTRFELPTHYVDGLRPKKPKNNEFVESGSENWALVNQTNTRKDSDDKRMKRKEVVLKISSSENSKDICSFILLKSPITSSILESLFVSPFFSIPPSRFFFFLLYSLSFSSPPSTCMLDG